MTEREARIKESTERYYRMSGKSKEEIDRIMKRWGMTKEVDLSKIDWTKVSEEISFENVLADN
jgi:hypothetical protein